MAKPNRTTPIIGIYKITSPTDRVYIGQSWDVHRRWKFHKNEYHLDNLIQRSFKKHGYSNHDFELVHELPMTATQDDLNHYERHYIQVYKERGASMLNLTEGGSNGRPTEEILEKLRRPKSEAHKANMRIALKKSWAEGDRRKPPPLSAESRAKISATMKGRKYSAERVANATQNRKMTPEVRRKISECLQGRSAGVKLTPSQVLEIRAKYIPRIYTLRTLAAEYGVDNRTIRDVLSRKRWRHV